MILGTAQFGMPYGIANRGGQIAIDEAAAILHCARRAGVDMLDTAAAYRDSESRLGELGVGKWKVITKLPPVTGSCSDAGAWVRETVAVSSARLRVDRLYGLLLHRSQDLCGVHGEAIYSAMAMLRAEGRVARIGVSIYQPDELVALIPRFALDLVQAPFNVLDRRMAASGWFARLRAAGVEVHIRSVFLQGLLLIPAEERPLRFARWQSLWRLWDDWLRAHQVTPLQACTAFALAQPDVTGVVVGVDSCGQLADIIKTAATSLVAQPPPELSSHDVDLINPSHWVNA